MKLPLALNGPAAEGYPDPAAGTRRPAACAPARAPPFSAAGARRYQPPGRRPGSDLAHLRLDEPAGAA